MGRYEILSIIGSSILSAFVFFSISAAKPKVQVISFEQPMVIEIEVIQIEEPMVITSSKNK